MILDRFCADLTPKQIKNGWNGDENDRENTALTA